MEEQGAKDLIVELCQLFYQLRWCTGSGGALSIRVGSVILSSLSPHPDLFLFGEPSLMIVGRQRAFVTPSAVQKERIKQEELFELDLDSNQIVYSPPSFVPSSCVPLFLSVYKYPRLPLCLFLSHSHPLID